MNPKDKHNIPKKTGFSIPKDYFDGFEESLEQKISEDNFPKKPGFTIPSGYLDNFKVDTPKSKKEPKVVFLNTTFRYAIAASFVIAFFTTLYAISFDNNEYEVLYDKLSQEDVNHWLDENDIEIRPTDFIAVYENEISNDDELVSTAIKDTSIEKYLNESSELEIVINEFY